MSANRLLQILIISLLLGISSANATMIPYFVETRTKIGGIYFKDNENIEIKSEVLKFTFGEVFKREGFSFAVSPISETVVEYKIFNKENRNKTITIYFPVLNYDERMAVYNDIYGINVYKNNKAVQYNLVNFEETVRKKELSRIIWAFTNKFYNSYLKKEIPYDTVIESRYNGMLLEELVNKNYVNAKAAKFELQLEGNSISLLTIKCKFPVFYVCVEGEVYGNINVFNEAILDWEIFFQYQYMFSTLEKKVEDKSIHIILPTKMEIFTTIPIEKEIVNKEKTEYILMSNNFFQYCPVNLKKAYYDKVLGQNIIKDKKIAFMLMFSAFPAFPIYFYWTQINFFNNCLNVAFHYQ